ncbi:molybdopterin-guanine dinucleotide biosynthesis protein B [Paenibacillus endophyticus]|uniref:Molybdopterin-guanine dinucleotide biosynthesis protein B n=1 Tax=Paenibacillus endophyticus TaxID=1294268 RepID=A0A7W5CCY3_9BACL|nr:molybdopterin-guanine dinucleotide biosynthesis protein B [Paenibacillus endophyticus]MBB3154814.1 molybdopterin-guanine dinucleotide biosynthesis protein B [Paenibacillus endophyticus]
MPIIIQIVGYKNTGKTTLVCRLTEHLKLAGYKVGTVKRDAHDFQIDTPGTDTWKHQAAGADITAITSANRTAILKPYSEPLDQLLAHMSEVDVVLVEGFKDASYPKIIMIRSAQDTALLNELTNPLAAALWPEMSNFMADNSSIPAIDVNQTALMYQKIIALLPLS